MSDDREPINPYDALESNVLPRTTNGGPANDYLKPAPLHARLVCELIGTCLFILFGAGYAAKIEVGGVLTVAVAHGLTAMWLIYVFGDVSGAHFNAGPTIVTFIDGKMSIYEAIGYLVAQLIGSLVAGALLLALYGSDSTLGIPALAPGVEIWRGFILEFLCTTILSFVIHFTTSYNTHKEAAFPIGLTVLSCFLIAADRDGSALNPWRWFGPAVFTGTFTSYCWIYVVGPIGGFILGYALFRIYKFVWNGNNYNRLN